MNEADRIVAQREQAASGAPAATTAETLLATSEERMASWERIVAAVPPALAALEHRGWPGGTMIQLQRKTIVGIPRTDTRAGWAAARYSFPWEGEQTHAVVYVLSDGRLAQVGAGFTILLENRYAVGHIVDRDGVWTHFPLDALERGLRHLAETGEEA